MAKIVQLVDKDEQPVFPSISGEQFDDFIEYTTVDPGPGGELAAGHFTIVYEE